MTGLVVCAAQIDSGADIEANLELVRERVTAGAQAGARLVILPEYCDVRGTQEEVERAASSLDGPFVSTVASLARELGVYVYLGSFHRKEAGAQKMTNCGVLIDDRGSRVATYEKLHLYDAVIGGFVFRESDEFAAGHEIVTVEIDGVRIGLSMCYDIRFPEMFRVMRARGAEAVIVPAAFNERTGRDHWEPLLRARAIENQVYVLASAQIGGPVGAIPCLGRSMVIDPWGTILATMPDEQGQIVVNIKSENVARVRGTLPAWDHRRPDIY